MLSATKIFLILLLSYHYAVSLYSCLWKRHLFETRNLLCKCCDMLASVSFVSWLHCKHDFVQDLNHILHLNQIKKCKRKFSWRDARITTKFINYLKIMVCSHYQPKWQWDLEWLASWWRDQEHLRFLGTGLTDLTLQSSWC